MNTDHFAKLPMELLLQVCDELPTESIVCLALTKKSLYESHELRELWQPRMNPDQSIITYPKKFPARNLGPEEPEREMLHLRRDILNYDLLCTLELLHRNLPDHWFCDICLKLHKRIAHTTDGRAYPPCDEGRRQGLFYRLRTWNYEISFEHAQQVVKQHTLGAPHGSPLTILQIDHEWETISDWPNQQVRSPGQPPLVWYRQLKVTPQIVQEEEIGAVLNLWTEQRLFFPSDYVNVFQSRSRDWVGDIGRRAQAHFSVCCHRHDTGRDVADLLDSLSVRYKTNSDLKRCEICLTEYAFFIREGNYDSSIHVVLSTWITLGTCRYSFSPSWLASSWLSSRHDYFFGVIVYTPPRLLDDDNSAFYSDRVIKRAIELKRKTIVRPSGTVWHLNPSWFNEPEQMRSWTRTELMVDTTHGERVHSERKWQTWWYEALQRWWQRWWHGR